MKTSTLLVTLTLAATALCTPAVLQDGQGSDGDVDANAQADGGVQTLGLGSPAIVEPIDWDLDDGGGSTDTDSGLDTAPDNEIIPLAAGSEVFPLDSEPSVGEDDPSEGGDDSSDPSASVQIEPLGEGASASAEAGLGSIHLPPFVNPLLPPLHPTVRTGTTTKAAKPTTKSATKSKAGPPLTRSSTATKSATKSKAGHPLTRSSTATKSATKSKAGHPLTKSSTHETKIGHPITKSATTKHAACTTTTTQKLARLTKSPYYKACSFDGTDRVYPGTTTKFAHVDCHGCSKIVTEFKPPFIHCPAQTIKTRVTEKKLFTTTHTICKPTQTK